MKEVAASVDTRLTQLEKSLEDLKILYEQHFAGIQRRPPEKEHTSFKRTLEQFPLGDLKSTAYRFRYGSIKSRYIQLRDLWNKIEAQIEEGTYKRDIFLLHAKEKNNAKAGSGSNTLPKPSSLEPGLQASFEKVYQKLSGLVEEAKLPKKEVFLQNLGAQIQKLREKDPKGRPEIKLVRDKSGRVQVNVKLKTS